MNSTWYYKLPDSDKVFIIHFLVDIDFELLSTYFPENAIIMPQVNIINDLPREFRNAWCINDTSLEMNYIAARDIIREERNKSLQKLDILSVSADRSNNAEKIEQINIEAQRLRDIPQKTDFELDDSSKLLELLKQARIQEL